MALTKINSNLISNNTVANTNIADNAVDATKIASNSILTRHIDDAQITTDQILDGTIATADIADDAVTEDKLANAINTSIAAKLPLAGGTMTGAVGIGGSPSATLHITQSTDGSGVSGQEVNTAYFHNQEATAGHNYGLRIKAGSNATDYALRVDTLATNGVFEVEGDGTTTISGSHTAGALLTVYNSFSSDANNVLLVRGGANESDGKVLEVQDHAGNSDFAVMGDGKVGIGTTSPSGPLHIKKDASETNLVVQSNVGGSGSNIGGRLRLQLGAQSNSGSGNADTQAGDTLGQIMFEGQGTDYSYQGGNIKTIVTTGDGDDNRSNQATAMTFETIAVGSVSPAERFRITSAGTFGMGSGSGSLAGSIIINNDGLMGTINNAYYNTVLGWEAADDLTTGDSNTVIGNQAGYKLTEGANNTFIGRLAGETVSTGGGNIAIGYDSLGGTVTNGKTGNYNVAVGHETLQAITSGGENVCMGRDAGHDITTGSQNVAIGHESLSKMQTNGETVAVGFQALENAISVGNTAVGSKAGELIGGTGQFNTCIGYHAGDSITSGYRNTMLGQSTDVSAAGGAYQIAIGEDCICTGQNNITVGSGNSTNRWWLNFTSNTGWARYSDQRYKENITDNTSLGLAFINDLRPVTFNWKKKSEIDSTLPGYDPTDNADGLQGPPLNTKKQWGLIAQEVKAVIDDHGVTDFGAWDIEETTGVQGVAAEAFIHPLIKAVQELTTKLEAAEARIATLEG